MLAVCHIFGLASGCTGAAEKPQGADGVQEFWTEFRNATAAADSKRLEELTAFPFTVRGPLDSDPAKTFDRASFRALIPRLLAQDSGLTEKGESMRQLVARTLKPPGAAAQAAQTTFRVGAFEFRVIEKKWRFVRAYLDE